MLRLISTFLILLFLSGCATTAAGKRVAVVTKVSEKCKNLGPVTVTMTGLGLPVEALNVLRNNTADKGGNTLVQTGSGAGIAYDCPKGSSRN